MHHAWLLKHQVSSWVVYLVSIGQSGTDIALIHEVWFERRETDPPAFASLISPLAHTPFTPHTDIVSIKYLERHLGWPPLFSGRLWPHFEKQPALVINHGLDVGHGPQELREGSIKGILKLSLVLIS